MIEGSVVMTNKSFYPKFIKMGILVISASLILAFISLNELDRCKILRPDGECILREVQRILSVESAESVHPHLIGLCKRIDSSSPRVSCFELVAETLAPVNFDLARSTCLSIQEHEISQTKTKQENCLRKILKLRDTSFLMEV